MHDESEVLSFGVDELRVSELVVEVENQRLKVFQIKQNAFGVYLTSK